MAEEPEHNQEDLSDEALARLHNRHHLITKGADLLRTLFRGSIVLGCLLIIKAMVVPFAGLESQADIRFLFRLVTDLSADQWVAYILAGGSALVGYRERRLRKRYIARYSDRMKDLEHRLDSRRASSGLLETGDTRPED